MEVKEFKKDFKIYNLKNINNDIVEIYCINYNLLKIKFEISDIISLDNNIPEKINKEEDFNIKEFKNIKEIYFFL